MLNLDTFVDECKAAVTADPSHKTITEIMRRACSDPADVLRAVGEPRESGVTPIYRSSNLTILNVVWKPGMTVMPHNHKLWAVIGVYGGREDNIFWRRLTDDPNHRIEAAGAKSLGSGDVVPLGRDIIHSVTNPLTKLTGAIHIYGGDFFEVERSEWDAENLTEHRFDLAKAQALFRQ